MSVLGIGVDLVECARIEIVLLERFADRFLHRVFTEGEIAYSKSMLNFSVAACLRRRKGLESVLAPESVKSWVGDVDGNARKMGTVSALTEELKSWRQPTGVTSSLITLVPDTDHHARAMIVLEG